MTSKAYIRVVQSAITDEIFFALGLDRRGVLRRMLGWVFALPTHRFARYMVAVDEAVASGGSLAGCRVMMDAMGVQIDARGESNIPKSGPVLLLANHPGAYDAMAVGSLVPRPDLHVIATKARLYQVLPNVCCYIHMIVKGCPREGMIALRGVIEHLQKDGILLLFGGGQIEPDPATDLIDDRVFAKWSRSIEILLRKVPGLVVVPTISSHVLLERFRDSPIAKLRRTGLDRRRLAEFTQVLQQLIFPKSVRAHTRISYGKPFMLADLEGGNEKRGVMPTVISRIKRELNGHLAWVDKQQQSKKGS